MEKNEIFGKKKQEFISLAKQKPWFDENVIQKALEFGEKKHEGQTRKVTENPYFIHPIQVAINILDETDTDLDVVVAALLHDTVENTDTSLSEINQQFNDKVKILVDGMTKPDPKLKSVLGADKYYEDYFSHLEKISKIDKRVMKIKLSDRIDNLTSYKLFAGREKVENYIWESYQYLGMSKRINLLTDLIFVLKDKLKPLEDFISH